MNNTRKNKQYEAALAYVQANYSHLTAGVTFELRSNVNADGTYWNGTVTVRNARHCAAEFVNTLVHELTHHKQAVEGRPFYEHEAYAAGDAAQRQAFRTKWAEGWA